VSRIKVFVAATAVSMVALVGLAAPASAALIGPPDPDAELLRVCITIRPSAPLCVNL
jgi:hypothetical protein